MLASFIIRKTKIGESTCYLACILNHTFQCFRHQPFVSIWLKQSILYRAFIKNFAANIVDSPITQNESARFKCSHFIPPMISNFRFCIANRIPQSHSYIYYIFIKFPSPFSIYICCPFALFFVPYFFFLIHFSVQKHVLQRKIS